MCISFNYSDACVLCHLENLLDCYTLSDTDKEGEEHSVGLSCHSPLCPTYKKEEEKGTCSLPSPKSLWSQFRGNSPLRSK